MNKTKEIHQIDEIVDSLTSKLYYHGHPINRKEASEQIGLKTVENATPKVEEIMWNLFLEYEKEIKSEEPFDPLMEFISAHPTLSASSSDTINIKSKIAFIESTERTDFVELVHSIFGTKLANGSYQITPNLIERGWKNE